MVHGVQSYFFERARCARRTAGIAATLGAFVFAVLLATSLTPLRRPVDDLLRRTVRFGYEGPDQYVRRIRLQPAAGQGTVPRNVGAVDARSSRRGGSLRARRTTDPRAEPETGPRVLGTGTSSDELMPRAVTRLANVPIVRSEDLVIEHAVEPHYPEYERAFGISGRVRIQALVDTSGRVVDVQVLASTGRESFERSVQEAVWQYRFKPYDPAKLSLGVYVILPFWFH